MEECIALLKRGRKLSVSQKITLAVSTVCIFGLNYFAPRVVYEKWPILGALLAICLGFMFLMRLMASGSTTHSSTQLAICALTLAVTIMQFEENVMDLSYQEYAFAHYSNNLLDSVVPFFNCADIDSCAFDRANILAFNTVGLWLPLFNMPFLFNTHPLYAIFIIGYTLGNVAGLVGAALWNFSYAPGMASGIVLVGPCAVWCCMRIIRHQFIGDNLIWVILAGSSPWLYGCIGGAVFFVNMTHMLPNFLWPPLMFAASVVAPYFFGKSFGSIIEAYHDRVKRDERMGDLFLESEAEALL